MSVRLWTRPLILSIVLSSSITGSSSCQDIAMPTEVITYMEVRLLDTTGSCKNIRTVQSVTSSAICWTSSRMESVPSARLVQRWSRTHLLD